MQGELKVLGRAVPGSKPHILLVTITTAAHVCAGEEGSPGGNKVQDDGAPVHIL